MRSSRPGRIRDRGDLRPHCVCRERSCLRSVTQGPRNRWIPRNFGGHENPPVISDGTGEFTAVLDIDSIPFQLTGTRGRRGALPTKLTCISPTSATTAASSRSVLQPRQHAGRRAGASMPSTSPPGLVEGEILAADVLPVAEGEPPAAIPIIGAGDLEGLKLLDAAGRGLRQRAYASTCNRRDPRSASEPIAGACAPQITGSATSLSRPSSRLHLVASRRARGPPWRNWHVTSRTINR